MYWHAAYFILFSTSAGHNRPFYQRVNDVVRRSWRGRGEGPRGILILTLGEASQFLMLVFHPEGVSFFPRWAAQGCEKPALGHRPGALGHRKKPALGHGLAYRFLLLRYHTG